MSSLAWMFKATSFFVVLETCFMPKVLASSKDDKILALPEQPSVNFNQYAGYINVNDVEQRSMFYYFVESETNPQTKPLVLWLTGGPGCSSVGIGAFSEHGPFRPKGDVLIKNKYSWNTEANMLYLESPAGVGFSIASNRSYYVNDAITAQDNLKFLLRWLERYPKYKNRDFFITGASYSGHYVPQLANLVLKSKLKSSLKGIAIGNPLLEFNADLNSIGDYFWSHGLISESTYAMLNTVCNYSQIGRQMIAGNFNTDCFKVNRQLVQEIGQFVDQEDVIVDVCLSSLSSQATRLTPLSKRRKLSGEVDVCLLNETTKYLNRKDVQRVIHAKLVGIDKWSYCNSDINYDMRDLEVPALPLLGVLVKFGVRVLVYSGDQDSVIPLIGTRSLLNALANELGLNTSVPYRSWLLNKQVGGWTQAYSDMLSYATIRGGAHEASMTQPERSLLLFKHFLQGKPLPQANP